MRTLEELLGYKGRLFQRLHASFSELLFAYDGRSSVKAVPACRAVSLHAVLRSMGEVKLLTLLCDLLVGNRVFVVCHAKQVFERATAYLAYFRTLLSPSANVEFCEKNLDIDLTEISVFDVLTDESFAYRSSIK